MEINKLSYEEAVLKLESLLIDLEDEDCTLSDSLAKFKEGMELYKHCSSILKKTEGEVKIILGTNKDLIADFNYTKEEENEY